MQQFDSRAISTMGGHAQGDLVSVQMCILQGSDRRYIDRQQLGRYYSTSKGGRMTPRGQRGDCRCVEEQAFLIDPWEKQLIVFQRKDNFMDKMSLFPLLCITFFLHDLYH